jgi:hypothetical protein
MKGGGGGGAAAAGGPPVGIAGCPATVVIFVLLVVGVQSL